MTSAQSLFRELHALGVVLSIDDRGRLSFEAPEGVVSESLIVRIRAEGDALLAIVERIDERAAIMEYDAGFLRADAERIARMEVVDDAPEPMPMGVHCPACQGRRLIDDPQGLRCWGCGRIAWVRIKGAIVRADCTEIDLDIQPETNERGSSWRLGRGSHRSDPGAS